MVQATRTELSVNPRAVLGKKVKKMRREGVTPANIFGHNVESKAIQVFTSDLKHVLRSAGLADPFRFHLAQAELFGLLAMIAFVELARRSRLARVSTWPSGGEAAATVTESS